MNADQKMKAAANYKLHKRLITAITVLDSDVRFATEQWRRNPTSQFWRRTLVRCCCASVEGTLSLLKNVTAGNADYFGVKLSEGDIKVVTELRTYNENGVTKTKPAFLPFRDNVKETFKVFAKGCATQVAIKYDVSEFADLCDTFELRNKLMHPKGVFDLEVSDKSADVGDRGLKWFRLTLEKVLQECRKKLPFSRNTTNNHIPRSSE